MILVGPGGVLVTDVKAWRDVSVRDGSLYRGDACCNDEVDKLLRVTGLVEQAVAELGLAPVQVVPVLVFAGVPTLRATLGRVELVDEASAPSYALRRGARLSNEQVHTVADLLEEAFPPYGEQPPPRLALVPEPVLPRIPAKAGPLDALFDVDDLVDAELEAAAAGTPEDWMVFLHPTQVKLVRRAWNGPARVRGPAGTGKTVVGLHRAAYLATTRPGRLLYVSYVRTLPLVLASLYERLAPGTADRVEFTGLHAWAARLLAGRGQRVRLDGRQVDTLFARAWLAVGRRSALSAVEVAPTYWQQEIDHVLKGRGLTEFEQYAALPRLGRRVRLDRAQREAVWDLYVAYEGLLHAAGLADFNDLLLLAAASLDAEPLDPGYAGVVVDEVQDLNCAGLRLLHRVAGDTPDGLLLIGDGQQSIYPGGFTLAEAGISVQGRAAVLTTNYRNSAEVLEVAARVVADDAFDDLGDAPEAGRRDVEVVRRGGQTNTVEAPDRVSHDAALLAQIRRARSELGLAWGDLAVLAESRSLARSYVGVLRAAGVPTVTLEEYEGRPVDAVKVGTVKRAKGLEFPCVFLPLLRRGPSAPWEGEAASAYEERLARERRELYVGMTRARDRLWLGYLGGPLPGARREDRTGSDERLSGKPAGVVRQ